MALHRKISILGSPLTKFEATGFIRPKANRGRFILCSVCHKGGGTLVQDGRGGYRHPLCQKNSY